MITNLHVLERCLKVSVTNGKLCIKASLRHFPECVMQLFFSHFDPKPCIMRSFGLQLTCFPRSPIPQTQEESSWRHLESYWPSFVKPPPEGLLNNANYCFPWAHLRWVNLTASLHSTVIVGSWSSWQRRKKPWVTRLCWKTCRSWQQNISSSPRAPAEKLVGEFFSGVAPANQTKERAKTKSSWISPIFVNSGVFFFPWENKHDSHWTFVLECPCGKFMNWPFSFLWFGLPGPLLTIYIYIYIFFFFLREIWGIFGPTKWIGCTPKGAYSTRGRSRHLLETPFSEPLLRTLLTTLFYRKTHSRPPSQNPSKNPSPEPFPEPSQNPS